MENTIQDLRNKAKIAYIAGTIYASGIPITLAFINNPVVQTVIAIALISMTSIEWRREIVANSQINALGKTITPVNGANTEPASTTVRHKPDKKNR